MMRITKNVADAVTDVPDAGTPQLGNLIDLEEKLFQFLPGRPRHFLVPSLASIERNTPSRQPAPIELRRGSCPLRAPTLER